MALRDEMDTVRAHTPLKINTQIDLETAEDVDRFGVPSKPIISYQIKRLEEEWDIERYLELTVATLGIAGIVLGTTVSKRWLTLTGVALGVLLQEALAGWCTPISLLRRRGVRTRKEIDEEKFALKALRGDFRDVATEGEADHDYAIASALQAVRR